MNAGGVPHVADDDKQIKKNKLKKIKKVVDKDLNI